MLATSRFAVRDVAVALAINVVWGLNVVAVKLSVDLVPPLTAAFLRQAIVLIVCLPWLRPVPGRMREIAALAIIVGGLFFAVINWSMAISDNVGALAIAGQLGAPFSLLLAVVFLGETIGWRRIVGMTLAIGGCALLVFDPAAAREMAGLLLTALSAVFWAIGSLLQRRMTGVIVATMYAWVGLGGVAILGPLALLVEPGALRNLTAVPPIAFLWIAGSALGSTLIGSGGMAWLLQRHPVSSVVPVTLGAPVIGVVASSIVFGKPITPIMVLGGIVALIGVAIVTIRTAPKEAQAI